MYTKILVGASLLLLTACGTQTSNIETQTWSVDTWVVQESVTTTQLTGTKVFLIDLGNSLSGSEILGCGDGLAYMEYDMSASQDPVYDTLAELLTLNPNDYAISGYYNSLGNAQLSVNSLSINNGVAEVYLNGTLSLGGACDNPRVVAQLEKTLLQFPNITSVDIYINSQALADFLSLQ